MVRGEEFAAAAAVLHLVPLGARAGGREVVVLQWGHVLPDGDNNRDQMRIGNIISPWRPPEWRGCSLGLGSEHELSPLDLELDLGGGPDTDSWPEVVGVLYTVQYNIVQYSTVQSVQYSTVQYSTVQHSTVQ